MEKKPDPDAEKKMTPQEIKDICERAAREDWSFEQLATAIGHGVNCARTLALMTFAGGPMGCECPKGGL